MGHYYGSPVLFRQFPATSPITPGGPGFNAHQQQSLVVAGTPGSQILVDGGHHPLGQLLPFAILLLQQVRESIGILIGLGHQQLIAERRMVEPAGGVETGADAESTSVAEIAPRCNPLRSTSA